jgi:hypothetical protein
MQRKLPPLKHAPSAYITCLVVPAGGSLEIDRSALELLGVTQVRGVMSDE